MDTDLFSLQHNAQHEPLAARMRPRNLDEYIGQEHLIAKGRLLRRAIQADRLSSLILYGPPGIGKTTLARVIANHTKSQFISINAVLTGVQQIREAVAAAEERKNLYSKRSILFVDEVHRWNKSQQDALLPWVENGTIILIGATTENPFFKVNNALVSRSRVFQLKTLSDKDLATVFNKALQDTERGYGNKKITIESDALDHLIHTAAGDARSLLNALELAVETAEPGQDGSINITIDIAEESIQQRVVLYDADGDYHYDVISAFIKSIRGSDPNAALYWLAKMLVAGEDPAFIFRRLMISACEDVGMAQPEAITIVTACAEAFDRVGLPEGRYHLTQATLYLATAKKSNSALAFFDALNAVQNDNGEVPNHLRDGSRDAAGLGHGADYKYPHNYHGHWLPQQYLPEGMADRVFYKPSTEGYEATIREQIIQHQQHSLQDFAYNEHIFLDDNNTNDFVSPIASQLSQWARVLLYAPSSIASIESISVQCPKGCTFVLCKNEQSYKLFQYYAESLEFFSKPIIRLQTEQVFHFDDIDFDLIIADNPAHNPQEYALFFAHCRANMNAKTKLSFQLTLPQNRSKLSEIITQNYVVTTHDIELLIQAEQAFLLEQSNDKSHWDEKLVLDLATKAGLSLRVFSEELKLTHQYSTRQLDHWFSLQSAYGVFLSNKGFPLEQLRNIVQCLANRKISLTTLQHRFEGKLSH